MAKIYNYEGNTNKKAPIDEALFILITTFGAARMLRLMTGPLFIESRFAKMSVQIVQIFLSFMICGRCTDYYKCIKNMLTASKKEAENG